MPYQIIPLPNKASDLALQVFGKLLVIAPTELDKRMRVKWLCVCHCGTVVTRTANCLKKPRRHSCGCVGKNIQHGATGTREHAIWIGMKNRCANPKAANFRWYGGRGITVCSEWLNSFDKFYRDMGECPQGHSLDRINNNGPYSPENCRWANHDTQSGNKRNNRFITHNNETRTVSEWARTLNLRPDTISYRIKKGWAMEKIFHPVTNPCKPTSHNN